MAAKVDVNNSPTVQGLVAHDAPISGAGNPVRNGARAVSSNFATAATNDLVDFITTLVGAQIIKPYSIPELEWQYACAAPITVTTDTAMSAAAGSGIRNYLTAIHLINIGATATEFVIKDGATAIFRGYLPANMTGMIDIQFPTPLKTAANAALNFQCIAAGSVYVSAQGYKAP